MIALTFDYTNWRGEPYRYVISPEPLLTCGRYDKGGMHEAGANEQWVIHGQLITRDGDDRPELAPNVRRRTFLLSGMSNIQSVETDDAVLKGEQ